MHKFDTKVQHLKFKVLREVAKEAFNGTLLDNVLDIPQRIMPGKEPTMRCCVYKERAILGERVKIAMGGNKKNSNVIEVIDIACDECPVGGYEVTDVCRGCIAHHCDDACKKGAITYDKNHTAIIDKDKCVNCGMCAKACPYQAIVKRERPCQKACKVNAISMGESKEAKINNDKCISCGSCVYKCPFGAIDSKSYILDVIHYLKGSENNEKYKVYAVVAPAIASQFSYAKIGQVITGIKQLGFHTVVEAALGADMVAYKETQELVEKGFITSSCCPAFVNYIGKNFPTMKEHISHNLSPMAEISKYIKSYDLDAKVVFIGPCTAKKMERQLDSVSPYVDVVITFEELQALFAGKDIEVETLEETPLDDASFFGRIFARAGGLADAVKQGLKEIDRDDFEYMSLPCNGIEECKLALIKASKGVIKGNYFIEGMACEGGCVGGAGCLTHGDKNKIAVDKFSKTSSLDTIVESVENAREF